MSADNSFRITTNTYSRNFATILLESKTAIINLRFRVVLLMIFFFLAAEIFYFFYFQVQNFEDASVFKNGALGLFFIFGTFTFLEFLHRRVQFYFLENGKVNQSKHDQFVPTIVPFWIKVLVVFIEVSLPIVVAMFQVSNHKIRESPCCELAITHIPFMLLTMFYFRFDLCLFGAFVAGLERFLFYLNYSDASETNLWSIFYLILSGTMMGSIAILTRKVGDLALNNNMERLRVQEIFGRFVSPGVAQKLVEKPISLGGDSLKASVMFMDIRDFTKRSASMTPEASVEFLNKVFAFSVEEVEKAGGIVNKFLGDGFMAVFGTPIPLQNPAESAVGSAMGILQRLAVFNGSQQSEKVELGFGINSGPLISGVVGTKERKEFTVIGDTVNMASRIEGLNKELHSSLLVSESVFEKLAPAIRANFDAVPKVQVKGKEEPFTVYRWRNPGGK